MRYILTLNSEFFGFCYNHETVRKINGKIYNTKQNFVKINGIPIVTLGDYGLSNCSHIAKVINTTNFLKINGSPVCSIFDYAISNGIFGRFYKTPNKFVKSI